MNPTEIKVALLRKGVKQSDISKRLRVSRNAVHLVVHKRLVSQKIMEAVAEAIGKPEGFVFPEYFKAGASRKRFRPARATNGDHLTE